MYPRVFVISGPSGVGKSTIIQRMMVRFSDIRLSVSCTTRSPRKGETEGVHYRFLTKEKFETLIATDEFLEHAQYADNHYGTDRQHVLDTLAGGHHVLMDVDSQGAMSVKRRCKGAVFIFIAPPSIDVLRGRLVGRGTETVDSLKKRMALAENEISFSPEYDFVVINDNLDRAVEEAAGIVESEVAKEIPFRVEDASLPSMDPIGQASSEISARVREKVIRQLTEQMGTEMRQDLMNLVQERLKKVLDNDLHQIVLDSMRENGFGRR